MNIHKIPDKVRTEQEGKKVFIYFHGPTAKRRYIRLEDGSIVPYARYLWTKHNPDDIIREDENIHHKDFDPLNDYITNLEKINRDKHNELHNKQKRDRRKRSPRWRRRRQNWPN